MLLPNARVDLHALEAMLEDQFPGSGRPPRFEPVGEDSWCYRAGELWVSVRQDREGHHASAYEAARELRDSGLEFVLAPLAGRDGHVVHVVGGLPVVVSRFLEARPVSTGPPPVPAELDAVLDMVGQLHETVVAADIPAEDYEFPFADELRASIAAILDGPPETSPFSQSLHRLIVRSHRAIGRMMEDLRALGSLCVEADGEMVLTHGDLGSHNLLRHGAGLLLADWTGAMWAPPERDWFHVRRSFGIAGRVRAEMMRYYELRWALCEIAEYTAHLIGERAGTAEDEPAWRKLLLYVPGAGEAESGKGWPRDHDNVTVRLGLESPSSGNR